jgi:hypothetical protein
MWYLKKLIQWITILIQWITMLIHWITIFESAVLRGPASRRLGPGPLLQEQRPG